MRESKQLTEGANASGDLACTAHFLDQSLIFDFDGFSRMFTIIAVFSISISRAKNMRRTERRAVTGYLTTGSRGDEGCAAKNRCRESKKKLETREGKQDIPKQHEMKVSKTETRTLTEPVFARVRFPLQLFSLFSWSSSLFQMSASSSSETPFSPSSVCLPFFGLIVSRTFGFVFDQKCILVTGGAGFIGSHTCVELLEANYKVVVVDNLCNSSEISLQRVQQITGSWFRSIRLIYLTRRRSMRCSINITLMR